MASQSGVLMRAKSVKGPDIAEQALLESCRRRDQAAFGRLIDLYQARVYGFVRRMIRDEEEALDVTQEVFIRAYQALDRFDGRASLRTWLFRIAHNLCVDQARKRNRQPSVDTLNGYGDEEGTLDVVDNRWDPETMALSHELRDVVENAISTMSDKLRTVLLLHDREDMAYEEIAATIDVPVGTVKSRLFLAREHLQRSVSVYMTEAGGNH